MSPGDNVTFLSALDGQWHPGTVLHVCCEPPIYWVVDEYGWDQGCALAQLQPRAGGPTYAPRPPGPRRVP